MAENGVGTQVRWLSLFGDVPADRVERAVRFWAGVTGAAPGQPAGDDGEYLPLEPPDGDGWVWLQRVGSGEPGWHLDLHVPDMDAAAARARQLGASEVRRGSDVRVLRTPAGQPFCFAQEEPDRPRRRAAARTWPGGRSLVDQLSLDIPADRYAGECGFWAALLGWRLRGREGEFDRLAVPERLPAQLLLQRLDPGAADGPHAHPDLSADDRDAEVARHRDLGAQVVRRSEHWTTLRDPAGLVYCVTVRRTGVRFA